MHTRHRRPHLDANWRWAHETNSTRSCFQDGEWTDVCSVHGSGGSGLACAQRCALEGADYSDNYGVTTVDGAATLRYVTQIGTSANVESRVFLLAGDGRYRMFELLGREVRVDVEIATVGCGLNGALYFVRMEEDGGKGKGANAAGARYGTGYCDAECGQGIKFVAGRANVEGWYPGNSDLEMGRGPVGSCCAEMNVWESNSASYAVTAHPCVNPDFHLCVGNMCGRTYSTDQITHDCNMNGCGASPYRLGNRDFYGKEKTVDTGKKFTVLTRFHDSHISQSFIQDGQEIQTPPSQAPDIADNSIFDKFCDAQAYAFGEHNRFAELGGWRQMKTALAGKWVMVMSITHDTYAHMLWLDSVYPVDAAGWPGADRGPCPANGGDPHTAVIENPGAKVTFSDLRYGPIGTTG